MSEMSWGPGLAKKNIKLEQNYGAVIGDPSLGGPTTTTTTKLLQSCLTLCDPTRLPIPGSLQARTLEWVAISFSNA